MFRPRSATFVDWPLPVWLADKLIVFGPPDPTLTVVIVSPRREPPPGRRGSPVGRRLLLERRGEQARAADLLHAVAVAAEGVREVRVGDQQDTEARSGGLLGADEQRRVAVLPQVALRGRHHV